MTQENEESSLFSKYKKARKTGADAEPVPSPFRSAAPPGTPPAGKLPAPEPGPSGMERKPEEEERKSPPPAREGEMTGYLKRKIDELEARLRESQEKGLAFAYELKGREEARKESRREMEEFLAEVKRQQADSETARAHALELEKARARIEALELKIMQFSAPPPPPPAPLRPEIPAEEFSKLGTGLKAELAADFEVLGGEIFEKLLKENLAPLAARLAEESLAREKDKNDLRALAGSIADKAALFESVFSKRLGEMEAALSGFSSQLKDALAAADMGNSEVRSLALSSFEKISGLKAIVEAESGKMASAIEEIGSRLNAAAEAAGSENSGIRSLAQSSFEKISGLETALDAESGKMTSAVEEIRARLNAAAEAADRGNAEVRALARASFEKISGLETVVGTDLGRMASALEEFRSGLSSAAAGIEASRKETFEIVEGMKRVLQTGGGEAADAAVRRLTADSGSYDFGFINACFNNLEKAFCSAAEMLARAGADTRRAAGSHDSEAALLARRQAAILDAAARDMGMTLEIFRGVREEALRPIKKILGR